MTQSSSDSVIWWLSHPVTQSSGDSVIRWLSHPVTQSSCDSVILWLSHPVTQSSSDSVIQWLSHPVTQLPSTFAFVPLTKKSLVSALSFILKVFRRAQMGLLFLIPLTTGFQSTQNWFWRICSVGSSKLLQKFFSDANFLYNSPSEMCIIVKFYFICSYF